MHRNGVACMDMQHHFLSLLFFLIGLEGHKNMAENVK